VSTEPMLAAVVNGRVVSTLELGAIRHDHPAGERCWGCELEGASMLAELAERRLLAARARARDGKELDRDHG